MAVDTDEALERYDRHSGKKSPAYPDFTIAKFTVAEFRRAMVLSDTVLEHVAENLRKLGLPKQFRYFVCGDLIW
jgi:hypothetical protein